MKTLTELVAEVMNKAPHLYDCGCNEKLNAAARSAWLGRKKVPAREVINRAAHILAMQGFDAPALGEEDTVIAFAVESAAGDCLLSVLRKHWGHVPESTTVQFE